MKSSEHTLASLLATEGTQWHYHIPRFQREYVWKKNNWSKLIEDIYDNDPGHYMGSVICVSDGQELTPTSELIYEVVDGQQRLTTLSLLLCAIYKKLNKLSTIDFDQNENEDFIVMRNSIKRRLIKELILPNTHNLPWGIFRSGSLTYCLRVQPSTQYSNLDDYKQILKEIGVIPQAEYPKYVGNRRLYTAFSYFLSNIPDDLKGLSDLINRVNSLAFIHIIESTQSKAFMLFETLNYRGVPLSAIDIIKNKMLATLESKHAVSIDESYNKWLELLQNLPEDVDEVRFLRQFYNAFKYNPKVKVENITRATGSNVIAIYESLIKKNAQKTLSELIDKSKIYNQLVEAENYPNNSFSVALLDLERIGAAPSYTFLMFLLSLTEDSFVEPNVKDKTINLLCKYYFRRNVTDFPSTRELDAINIELVDKCVQEIEKGNKLSYAFISNEILTGRGQPTNLEKFQEILSDNLFYHNDYMARYALTKLDETSHSREYAPNLWQRNEKGLYVWTIEHVFPQGENIPLDWISMIGNGDKDKARTIQNQWVHCLGNLTLSGYNSKLSNESFGKKQAKTLANVFGSTIEIGYKNGLWLNNIPFLVDGKEMSLANADKWNLDFIKARNDKIVELITQLFKFPNE